MPKKNWRRGEGVGGQRAFPQGMFSLPKTERVKPLVETWLVSTGTEVMYMNFFKLLFLTVINLFCFRQCFI